MSVFVCPSCSFENPRAWRACARCGAALGDELSAAEMIDKTIVDANPLAAARPKEVIAVDDEGEDGDDLRETNPNLPNAAEALAAAAGKSAAPSVPPRASAPPPRARPSTRPSSRVSSAPSARPASSRPKSVEIPVDADDRSSQDRKLSSSEVESGDQGLSDPSHAELPLIGQTEAGTAVRTGVERAFSVGAPTLVALEGPRGSGKTRLLMYASEIAARVSPNVRILYGTCRPADGSYAPFSRLLLDRFVVTPSSAPTVVRAQMATVVREALPDKSASVLTEVTHFLGHLAGVPFPDSPVLAPLKDRPEALHGRALDAVRTFFEGDAQRRPVLVLLDNMHHAEPNAWDLLGALLEAEAHIAVIVAGDEPVAEHAEDLSPTGGVAIGPIGPLSEGDIASMLHLLVPQLTVAPEPLVAALTHRSKGNPAAIKELVLALAESGIFVHSDAGLVADVKRLDSGELPISLDDAVKTRLRRLDAIESATLERAAVIGVTFHDAAILAQMRSERQRPGTDGDPLSVWGDESDAAALAEALLRLTNKGFIEPDNSSPLPGATEYRFVRAATRDLLYDKSDPSLKVLRHRVVARWLTVAAEVNRKPVAALIAPHLELAGQTVRAGRAYLEAGVYAREQLDTRRGLEFISRALPLIPEDDVLRRIDGLLEQGTLLTTMGDYDQAVSVFTEIAGLAWTIGARSKGGAAFNRMGRVFRQRGENENALKFFQKALALFRRNADLRGVASTLDDIAQVLRLRSDHRHALEAASEALEIRRAHLDRRGEARSLTTIATIEYALGNLDSAEGLLKESLAIRDEVGDPSGTLDSHNALGVIGFLRGRTEQAIQAWAAALALARASADRRAECFLLNNLGECYLQQGDLVAADDALHEAERIAQLLGDKRAIAEVTRHLGLLALERGDDDAEERITNAAVLAEQYGGREAIGLAIRAVGQLRAMTLFDGDGKVDRRAEQSFVRSIQHFREISNEQEVAKSLAALGFHLLERGETDAAREHLKQARAIMRRLSLGGLERVERTMETL